MFQFQTGSIKSYTYFQVPVMLTEFQFQTGSIKSFNSAYQQRTYSWRFNSKLVRLKVGVCSVLIRFSVVSIPNWFD